MEMINRAIEDISDFKELIHKITGPLVADRRYKVVEPMPGENRTQRRERERREKAQARRMDKKLAKVRS